MDEKELLALIEKDESETVEFKKSTAEMERALRSACAFLNHRGGTVLFGIDRKRIVGQEVSGQTLRSISQRIRQRIKPEVSPEIRVLEAMGKKVVEVKLREGNGRMHYLDGVAYRRVGSENVVIPPDELERIILEKSKRHWDSEICENAKLEDVDEEKLRWFLRKAKHERNFDIEEETPAREALERLELTKDGKLTNAAILLFGKNPQKFFLQAEARCARFKGTEPVKPFIDMKVFGGNIIDQVDKSLSFVLEHIPMKVYLAGKPEREERYEYPPDAVREAIINAVCHRDYSEAGNVQVRIFGDRIEVWGCGRLPEPLTPEDLRKKHRSVPRNPLIAKCFFLIKFVEEWGTGTNDIIGMCVGWGLPEPLFEEVAGSLVVTFRKYHLTDEMLKELSGRQLSIAEYLRAHGKINRSECMKLLNTSKDTAFRELATLQKKGIVERKGGGKHVYYALK